MRGVEGVGSGGGHSGGNRSGHTLSRDRRV